MAMTRRVLGIGLLTVGLTLVAFVAVSALSDDSTSGDVSAIESTLRPAQPGPIRLGPPPTTTPTEVDDELTGEDTRDSTPDPVGDPVGLRIDSLGVDAPIDAYGVNQRTGQMAVPENVTDVGWYKFGPSPGESGSVVLAAHVDLAGSGPGVFFALDELEEGDQIVVVHDDGTEAPFRVVARTTYEKEALPLDVIFSREGPPVLTLVTCGGGFNRDISRYDSNVVVYAVPDLGTEPADGSTL